MFSNKKLNVDVGTTAILQIDNLFKNPKNMDTNAVKEVSQLLRHEPNADLYAMSCVCELVGHIEESSNVNQIIGELQKDPKLFSQPKFISCLSIAILKYFKEHEPTVHFLDELFQALDVNKIRMFMTLIVLYTCSDSKIKSFISGYFNSKMPEFLKECAVEGSLSTEAVDPSLDNFLITMAYTSDLVPKEHVELVCSAIRRELSNSIPLTITPFFSLTQEDNIIKSPFNSNSFITDEEAEEDHIVNCLKTIGPRFSQSVEICKKYLKCLFDVKITPSIVAKVLCFFLETDGTEFIKDESWNTLEKVLLNVDQQPSYDSTTYTWKFDVFASAAKFLNPNLKLIDIFNNLDMPNFDLRSGKHYMNLISICHSFPYEDSPVNAIYKLWNNYLAQLTLIENILAHPGTFNLLDSPCEFVDLTRLKDCHKVDKFTPVTAPWLVMKFVFKFRQSLSLLDTLLRLCTPTTYDRIVAVFETPIAQCPDVLAMALMQSEIEWIPLKCLLFSRAIRKVLPENCNAHNILSVAWSKVNYKNEIRSIVIECFIQWYEDTPENELQGRVLHRMIDVAAELKANETSYRPVDDCLHSLLNVVDPPFFFLDVGLTARKRGFVNVEKWLQDKLTVYGEPLILGVIKYLKEKAPFIMNVSAAVDESVPKNFQFAVDLAIILISSLVNVKHLITATNAMMDLSTMAANAKILSQSGICKSPSLSTLNLNVASNQMPSNSLISNNLINSSGIRGSSPVLQNIPYNVLQQQCAGNLQQFDASQVYRPQPPPNYPCQVPSALMRSSNPCFDMRMRPASLPLTPNSMFPENNNDVESLCGVLVQRMYGKGVLNQPHMSVDEILEVLRHYVEGENLQNRETYKRFLHNVFEEYKFVPQYSEKDAITIGSLYGGLIEKGFYLETQEFNFILSSIVDAADQKPFSAKMLQFAVSALERLKFRLCLLPDYCVQLKKVSFYYEFPRHLQEFIEYGSNKMFPPPSSQPSSFSQPNVAAAATFMQPNQYTTSPAAAALPNPIMVMPNMQSDDLMTLVKACNARTEKPKVPSSEVCHHVVFVFNNVTSSNYPQQAEILKKTILDEEGWNWFSEYLIVKRVAMEPNYHSVYCQLVDAIDLSFLNDCIVKDTYYFSRALLSSSTVFEKSADRTSLKNLGHWLGIVTLAKNKPILSVEIDLKSLIIEAYMKGPNYLHFVIPFVTKVLESCQKSKIFRLPNPWLLGVLSVLVELANKPTLKVPLRFEIEILLKKLNIEMSSITPSNILSDDGDKKNVVLHQQLAVSLNIPFNETVRESSMSNVAAGTAAPVAVQQPAVAPPPPPQPHISPIINVAPSVVTQSVNPMSVYPKPKYNFRDIKICGHQSNLSSLIEINPNIALLALQPHLRNYVLPAIEKSIQEVLPVVLERAAKISITATECLIKKDFAMECDEAIVRASAHNMLSNLSAGLVLISGREQLLQQLNANMRAAFTQYSQVLANTQQFKELIIDASNTVARDNVEVCLCYMSKITMIRSVQELEKRLQSVFERMSRTRLEGKPYVSPSFNVAQNEHLPDALKLTNDTRNNLLVVYDEFSRAIPGFKPLEAGEKDVLSEEFGSLIERAISEVENCTFGLNPHSKLMYGFVELREFLFSVARPANGVLVTAAATKLFTKLTYSLLEFYDEAYLENETDVVIRYRDCHLNLFRLFTENTILGHAFASKQITRAVMECQNEYKFNLTAISILIKSKLLNCSVFDSYIKKLIESEGVDGRAVKFAISLIRYCLIEASNHFCLTDFSQMIGVLQRLAVLHPSLDKRILMLMDLINMNYDMNESVADTRPNPINSLALLYSGLNLAKDVRDPEGYQEKTYALFREWYEKHYPIAISAISSRESHRNFTQFVMQMNNHGLFKSDDHITRFLRICIEYCVGNSYHVLSETSSPIQQQQSVSSRCLCYNYIDAFVKLIVLLIRHSGDPHNHSTKICLMSKVLGLIAGVCQNDHDMRNEGFYAMAYQRMFMSLFRELINLDFLADSIYFPFIQSFMNVYYLINPCNTPGFTFAWVELVGNGLFLGRVLSCPSVQKAWNMYATLLMCLIRFMSPYIKNFEICNWLPALYKGLLRIFLVLLHDFPEFLCEYYYEFCDCIPLNCIQLRNLVLSAFNRQLKLPDPFTPNLKVDMLPEITHFPRIHSSYVLNLQPQRFRNDLDSYLSSRSPVTFLSEMRTCLQQGSEGSKYNARIMNALVLYVGIQAIQYIHNKGHTPSMSTITHAPHMDIFQNLAVDLDSEGRYLFFNAMVNQLRYPNCHTHYFSCTVLYLFAEANSEIIREQITRVLVERLIVNRPHPWGLLITFIELLRNPIYTFWQHDFVRCAPEIEKLFLSVGKTCIQQQQQQQKLTP